MSSTRNSSRLWPRFVVAVIAIFGSACGDAPPSPDPSSAGGPMGSSTNPDGVPYPAPAEGYGHTPRSGQVPGSIVANYTFLGYPEGDSSKGLQKVSLVDFYDPCGARYKVIHLSVAAVWCQPCNAETDALAAAKARLGGAKVVVLQALDDGPTQGIGATEADLGYWVTQHHSNFDEVLDPGLVNLAGFFDPGALPWNADIDPRTMELLTSETGWSGDVGAMISAAENALPEAPGYPLPSVCR